MDKSVGISSQFVVALLIMAFMGASSIARGDARPAQKPGATQTTAKPSTPESNLLIQHDDVLPTQNRTQAMAIEAESGKLPAGEEDELKRRGLVRQVTQTSKR